MSPRMVRTRVPPKLDFGLIHAISTISSSIKQVFSSPCHVGCVKGHPARERRNNALRSASPCQVGRRFQRGSDVATEGRLHERLQQQEIENNDNPHCGISASV